MSQKRLKRLKSSKTPENAINSRKRCCCSNISYRRSTISSREAYSVNHFRKWMQVHRNPNPYESWWMYVRYLFFVVVEFLQYRLCETPWHVNRLEVQLAHRHRGIMQIQEFVLSEFADVRVVCINYFVIIIILVLTFVRITYGWIISVWKLSTNSR